MMIFKIPFLLTAYFLSLVSILGGNGPGDDFFQEQYQKINRNIEEGLYEENLELIEKLVQQQAYQELDCYRKGKILHKIGVSYYLLNRESEAIAYYKDTVLNVWKDCPEVPPSEKANTVYNIGISYQYLNDLEAAKGYIDKALYIFENDTLYSPLDLADKYHGIGKFYKNKNDAFRAELYYQNAINLYLQQDQAEALKFEVLNDLVTMSLSFKDYEKAKAYIKEALSIYSSVPESIDQLDLTLIYLNAGKTYFELQDYESARQMGQKALGMLNEETEPFYYAIALEIVAMIQTEEKKFVEAEENMYRVLNIRKALYLKGESRNEITRAYENLCEVLIQKGAVARTDHHLNQAFDMLLPTGSFDTDYLPIIRKSKALDDEQLMRLIELKVRIFEAKYQDSGDITFLKKALGTQHKIDSVINRSLVSFQFEQSKLDFLDLKFDHYGKAVEDALTLYKITKDRFYLEEAYFFSSKTKAIVLQYELNRANAFHSNVSEEVLHQEQSLRQEMYSLQEQLLESSPEQDSLLQAYVKAQYALDSYLKEIEKKEPAYFKEKYAFIHPPQLKAIQKNIPNDMAVVEYFISKDTIYSFWLTRDTFFPISIPYDQEIKNGLEDFIAQCHDPNREVSRRISQLIYKKCLKKGIKGIGEDISRLCIIPDGPLHKLPFEALIQADDGSKNYLIEDYTISYSYSIGLLLRESRREDLKKYVGFGTTYSHDLNEKLKARKIFFGNENLAQLSLSQEEIAQGASIFDGEKYINDKATLENFLQHGSDADIIHLSLHGLVDIDDPGRSCIIFDDHREEFILSPLDLYSHRLNAGLVLLSSCHSASGKIYSGEGVQGMSKSFLLSGARNILSSLWNASEVSSIAITTSFLENVHAGQSTDGALHQSKLDYISKAEPNMTHPYYWANFILLGEVDTYKESTNYLAWITIAGLLILLFLALRTSKIWRQRLKL